MKNAAEYKKDVKEHIFDENWIGAQDAYKSLARVTSFPGRRDEYLRLAGELQPKVDVQKKALAEAELKAAKAKVAKSE